MSRFKHEYIINSLKGKILLNKQAIFESLAGEGMSDEGRYSLAEKTYIENGIVLDDSVRAAVAGLMSANVRYRQQIEIMEVQYWKDAKNGITRDSDNVVQASDQEPPSFAIFVENGRVSNVTATDGTMRNYFLFHDVDGPHCRKPDYPMADAFKQEPESYLHTMDGAVNNPSELFKDAN